MGKRDASKGNRVHCKRVWLNDEELWQFNLAQRSSRLGASDFIRQRCLHIVKHKQVGIEQIQLYQELAVLQQQCEQMLKQMPQISSTVGVSVGCVGGGNSVGGDGGDVSSVSIDGVSIDGVDSAGTGSEEGESSQGQSVRGSVEHLIEQHIGSIKRLRQRLVKLDIGGDGDSGGGS